MRIGVYEAVAFAIRAEGPHKVDFGYCYWNGGSWGREAENPDDAVARANEKPTFEVNFWRGVPEGYQPRERGRPMPEWLARQLRK